MTVGRYSVGMLQQTVPDLRRRNLKNGWSYFYWNDPAAFSEQSQDWLFSLLVEISTKSFAADMTPYWRDRRRDRFFEKISRFCLLVDPSGDICGWTGYHRRIFGNAYCLYLDSSGLLPQWQGGGMMGWVHSRMITRECFRYAPSPVYLIARTESPVVYRLLQRGCGAKNIWPTPDAPPNKRVRLIGADAAEWLGQEDKFNADDLRILGAYDNLDVLYGDLPKCGDQHIDSFFRDTLRPEDAYIVIARAELAKLFGQWAKKELRVLRTGKPRRVEVFDAAPSSVAAEPTGR